MTTPKVRIQDMPQSTEDEINKRNSLLERAKSLGLNKTHLEVTEQDVLDAEANQGDSQDKQSGWWKKKS